MNNQEHDKHGIAVGTLTAITLKLSTEMSGLTAVLVGTAIGLGSTAYMKRYGHGLPSDNDHKQSRLKPHQL